MSIMCELSANNVHCVTIVCDDRDMFVLLVYHYAAIAPQLLAISGCDTVVWSHKMAKPKLSKAPELKSLPPTTEAFEHLFK